jgi:hypothetical protein
MIFGDAGMEGKEGNYMDLIGGFGVSFSSPVFCF